MTKEINFMVKRAPEGGYYAQALGQPIFTQAENLEELKAMVKDAVNCHFEVQPKIVFSQGKLIASW